MIKVNESEACYLFIGGKGQSNFSSTQTTTFVGGYNGGGGGQIGSLLYLSGSGGGGTDIRRGGNQFENRIIVAGGGGGAGPQSDDSRNGGQYGGAGGGENGLDGCPYHSIASVTTTAAGGASQTSGGVRGQNLLDSYEDQKGENGDIWKGVSATNIQSSGGGGGGGLFGGGSNHASGGGGGSGYIGKVFSYRNILAKTYDGSQKIPQPLGGYDPGYVGNGYIRITDLSHFIGSCHKSIPSHFVSFIYSLFMINS